MALFKQLPRRVSVLVVVRRALLFLLASLWAIPFLPVLAARSQTTVSGRIEQDTTWTQDSSPFVLIGQVVVVADVTLTIEPGVQVRGTVGSSLVVNGALNAVGTQEQRIILTSDSGQQDWSGIHLTTSFQPSQSPSALRFVTIERATRGIKWGLTHSGVQFSDNQLEGNGIALVFDNPIAGTVVQRSVFTNNGIAVTGMTRGLVGIYESDFWNNEINLLPRPESPYDCGQDDGVWDIHRNDILRGPVNSVYLSNDVQTPSGSGVSEYTVLAMDNWWGTTDDFSIRARTRENFECCPTPVEKRIEWNPFSSAPHTAWEPLGEVPYPAPEPESHGDPGTITTIERPRHSRCIDREELRRIRGDSAGVFEDVGRVSLALMRDTAGCRWWHPKEGRFLQGDCSQPNWFRPSHQKERAGGLLEWSYDLPKTLRAGRYVALATGGAEPIHAARNSNSFRLVDFPG
ncbi:MAG TPA: hypothetical protein VGL16_08780 [Actinomycetota bacterium]